MKTTYETPEVSQVELRPAEASLPGGGGGCPAVS